MTIALPKEGKQRFMVKASARKAMISAMRRVAYLRSPEAHLWVAVLEQAITEIGHPFYDSSWWFAHGHHASILGALKINPEYFSDLSRLAGLPVTAERATA